MNYLQEDTQHGQTVGEIGGVVVGSVSGVVVHQMQFGRIPAVTGRWLTCRWVR